MIWYVLNLKQKHLLHIYIVYWFLLAKKNKSEMFCHDPENRWILMPFPIILREDIEYNRTSTWCLFSHSLLLYRKSYSFVRFLPHLLLFKYHVLSLKYFYFVYTKVKEDFLFLWPRTYLRSLSCHNPQKRRTALIGAERRYTRRKYHHTLL